MVLPTNNAALIHSLLSVNVMYPWYSHVSDCTSTYSIGIKVGVALGIMLGKFDMDGIVVGAKEFFSEGDADTLGGDDGIAL
jgi:hypothetical protein